MSRAMFMLHIPRENVSSFIEYANAHDVRYRLKDGLEPLTPNEPLTVGIYGYSDWRDVQDTFTDDKRKEMWPKT